MCNQVAHFSSHAAERYRCDVKYSISLEEEGEEEEQGV
jgi:hypothetical protein